MTQDKRKQDQSDQSRRFIDAAREAECSEDEAVFDETLRRIVAGTPAGGHWSDCAVNNAPAFDAGACDCGGLDLAEDTRHNAIPASISRSRGNGRLVKKAVPNRFAKAQ